MPSSILSGDARDLRVIVLLGQVRQHDKSGAAVVAVVEEFRERRFERCPTRDRTRCFTDHGYGPMRSISRSWFDSIIRPSQPRRWCFTLSGM